MRKKLLTVLLGAAMIASLLTGCGSQTEETADKAAVEETEETVEETEADPDQAAADEVAALIDAIYVQQRTDETDAQCAAAKEAWDALTDAQKELVEGENADPDYFGRDTGDASLDDPRNQDEIGENELLVVSFGTSFNDSRVADIKSIEDALQEAYPDWSVRRAFTAQIIINHVQARDGEYIDNMDQALERAVSNGVKNLVIQPTHLMNGLEYHALAEQTEAYAGAFEQMVLGEPLLTSEEDFQKVIEAIIQDTADCGDGQTAVCLMGHGTEAQSNQVYDKLQKMLWESGYADYYVGTVEAEPSLEDVLEAVRKGSYRRIVLQPLMLVAGDHANNDMAGSGEGSWSRAFEEAGYKVECRIKGLGELKLIQDVFIEHARTAMDRLAEKKSRVH